MDHVDFFNWQPWVIFRTEGNCMEPQIPKGCAVLTSNDPVSFPTGFFSIGSPPPIVAICLKRPIAVREDGKIVPKRELIMRVRPYEDHLVGEYQKPIRPGESVHFQWEDIEILRPVVAAFDPDHPPFADGFIEKAP